MYSFVSVERSDALCNQLTHVAASCGVTWPLCKLCSEEGGQHGDLSTAHPPRYSDKCYYTPPVGALLANGIRYKNSLTHIGPPTANC